ncbi:hypothetical protein ABZT08_09225 [Streptomyces sp. NPDC005526]|uniref:hypothetical protein n=1 Tax=unclassified Streptomyces TaxID=2593676 RepID=UPI0033B2A905
MAAGAQTSGAHQDLLKPRPPFQQGKADGRAAGAADGENCNYRDSFNPLQSNSKYKAGYTAGYESAYDSACGE